MVVASPAPIPSEKIQELELPLINLSAKRSESSKLIVKACEEFGFFKVINHGVPESILRKMEYESLEFFAKPASEKMAAGPAKPYGYGVKNIGFNGDVGEVEYILLNVMSDPLSISHISSTIFSSDPTKFSPTVSGYLQAVRIVACEILELIAEGLRVPDTSVFSRLIRDVDSDSLFRLNHYPPLNLKDSDTSQASSFHQQISSNNTNRIGIGEHSDPQILTILRSNGVPGLQISLEDGVWVPVTPDPTAFFVNVGDLLQAMTNGRFVSVRHRALANSNEARLSISLFCGPPLHARISPPPELVTLERPLYRRFTWSEYKNVAYSLRLGETRLNLFKSQSEDEITD